MSEKSQKEPAIKPNDPPIVPGKNINKGRPGKLDRPPTNDEWLKHYIQRADEENRRARENENPPENPESPDETFDRLTRGMPRPWERGERPTREDVEDLIRRIRQSHPARPRPPFGSVIPPEIPPTANP
ncbi:MAG TPA: hypothetical protein VEW42_02860, partial [Candidatus Eisenbacteria bacterium]|nr:hypothetical protein [Candidatus Eisenbacteria bacterium]